MNDVFLEVENFIDHVYFQELSQFIQSENFLWSYNDDVSVHNPSQLGDYGFTHGFFTKDYPDGWVPDSQVVNFFKPVFFKIQSFIKCKNLLRARADMTTKRENNEYKLPVHQDFNFNHLATILYMNESDGDTIFYDSKKCSNEIARKSPVPNTLIIFQGNAWHTGCLPIKYNRRILLNSNYVQ